jgi:hypothetical protein
MDRNDMTNKSGIDIDINELVHALNSQVSTYNLELSVAKLYIAKLEGIVKELSESINSAQPQVSSTNKTKN